MELPKTRVTGLGGPAGGRDINATTAEPLLKGGACAGTHPCGCLGRHRLAGGGGCMANLGRDRPHGVPSGLSGFNMAAIDTKNPDEPPSTICPIRGRCPARGHAGVGGTGPALHVCPGPKGGGGQRMHIRPQGSGYLGVHPPPAMGQAVENFKGGSGFPGKTTVQRARPTPAHDRIMIQGGGVESLCRSGPILRHALQSGRNIVASPLEHLQSGNHVPGDQTRPSPDHETTGAIRAGMGYVAPQDRTRRGASIGTSSGSRNGYGQALAGHRQRRGQGACLETSGRNLPPVVGTSVEAPPVVG